MNEEKEINRIAAEAIEPGEKIQPEELPRLDNGMIDVETLSGGKKDCRIFAYRKIGKFGQRITGC